MCSLLNNFSSLAFNVSALFSPKKNLLPKIWASLGIYFFYFLKPALPSVLLYYTCTVSVCVTVYIYIYIYIYIYCSNPEWRHSGTC